MLASSMKNDGELTKHKPNVWALSNPWHTLKVKGGPGVCFSLFLLMYFVVVSQLLPSTVIYSKKKVTNHFYFSL